MSNIFLNSILHSHAYASVGKGYIMFRIEPSYLGIV